jgi:hypothetical protein
MNLRDVKELCSELERVMLNFTEFRGLQRQSMEFYKKSAFYVPVNGQAPDKVNKKQNLLRVFADKNIEYTAKMPLTKVPTSGPDQKSRQSASNREKIINGVHRKSGMAKLQKKWARDVTLYAIAIAETTFDLKDRCVKVKRHKPLKVYWQRSNDSEDRVIAFWAVFAITKEEAKRTYGVTPTSDPIGIDAKRSFSKVLDGQEWFTMAIRWDDETRVKWIGDQMVEQPHNHLLGEIPIDICDPFESEDEDELFPAFYLEPLIPLQAELNDAFYRRSTIVRRMSSPIAWVSGGAAAGKKGDDIKAQFEKPGGGVLSLSKDGQAGLLQLNDTRVINEHIADIIIGMTRIAGFGNAAFGESVGANTSGDALGMYFNATQRKIETQYISWTSFFESINAKILKFYAKMLTATEQVSLDGFSPAPTLMAIKNKDGSDSYKVERGAYSITFTRDDIGQNFSSVIIAPTNTPKNELAERQWATNAVGQKVISRTTAYEFMGIQSPEDELELLKAEQQDPSMNPDGLKKMVDAMVASQGGMGGGQGQPQLPQPAQFPQQPQELPANVR